MKQILKFGILLISFDLLWIKTVMLPMYKKWFKFINIKMKSNIVSMFIAYSIMVSIYPLFIQHNNKQLELMRAITIGGVVFGLYGFTVASIFPKYSISFALIETLWGMLLYGITTYLSNKL